ncbi:MAG: beta-glucosidase [Candidatus Thorarchaeota archaeon]
MSEDVNFNDQVENLLSKLSLKEKFQLMTSKGFRRIYSTHPVKRLGIPSFKMSDGPLGMSRHSAGFRKATRFPSTISLASTWDRSLAYEMGKAMANEIRAIGRHMLLAPGINIQRTPLCGRNFEYFSEDPYLTKELAIPLVRGVQGEGIGACIKHYAANNQEIDRRSSSSEIDERTLHEIYLKAFEEIVKEANPWAVMGAYNKVNGVYACENPYLLKEVLMERWGFDGFVMTDWFATRPIKSPENCVMAGLSLEMPVSNVYKPNRLQKALDEGLISIEMIDSLLRRYLRVMYLTGAFSNTTELPSGEINTAKHQSLARKIGEEGAVLLKNEGNLLPLEISNLNNVALLGPNLKKKFGRLLSGGSSAVVPPYEITPLEGMREKLRGKVKIVSRPEDAEVAILFVGLNHSKGQDSETYDRSQLELPDKQVELIQSTVEKNPNTVVVIIAGSPIAMDPWLEKVPAVLLPWYSGMEGGRVIANVLFGDVNPSGKLPITFPKVLSDSPAHSTDNTRTYPGNENKNVYYEERIMVGYRWFDETDIKPLFPFGYGLSYSSFEIKDIKIDKVSLASATDKTIVNVDVSNTSDIQGAQVIQIYSHDIKTSVVRPRKELVGFGKIFLNPSETQTIPIEICAKDLAFYDVDSKDWMIEAGDFELQIGTSSRGIDKTASLSFD